MDDLADFTPDAIRAEAGIKPAAPRAPALVQPGDADKDAIFNDQSRRLSLAYDAARRSGDQQAIARAQRDIDNFTREVTRGKGAPTSLRVGSPAPAPAPDADLADFTPEALRAEATSPPPAPAAPASRYGTVAGKDGASVNTDPQMDLTAHAVSSVGAPIGAGLAGGGRFLWELVNGNGLDKAASAGADTVRSVEDTLTYRPRTAAGQQMSDQFDSKFNPLTWIPRAGEWAGSGLGGLLTDAGAPGAGALVNGGVQAATNLLPFKAKGGVRALREFVAPEAEQARIDPTLDSKPRYRLGLDGKPVLIEPTMPIRPASPVAMERVPSVNADATPAPTRLSPNAAGRGQAANPGEQFREIEPTDQPITDSAERLRRANVLRSVGIDTTRESALAGDKVSGSTDLQFSKVDSPGGRYIGGVLDSEKAALQQHAEQLVHETGGTLDKDQTTAYQRGDAITRPLKELEDYYDGKARDLYGAADARAQGVPVRLNSFGTSLNDPSLITQPSHPLFQNAVKAKAQQIGMQVAEDGSISGTAKQAEVLRKYLNQNGKGANAGFAGALKESLDNDVMSSSGDDLYTEARRLWAEKKNTLDNPNGIAKLLQEEGPNGINRAIPLEQVAPKLAKMPVDQFGHVVDTLKNAPEEVKPSASAALNEIRAHFANEVRNIGGSQKGQWAADKVTRYLRDNAARMNQVFSPEEMAKFRNLSEAGQIVAKDQSYPGAAAQAANLGKAGAIPSLIPHAAAAAGGVIGHLAGPLGSGAGAYVGRVAGNKAAAGMADKASLKSAQGRTVKLSDLLETGR